MPQLINQQKTIYGAILIAICMLLRSTDVYFRGNLLLIFTPLILITLEHFIGSVALLFKLKLLKSIFKINKNNILALSFVVLGSSVGGIYFFTKAFNYMNPAVVILLQKFQPIIVIILSLIVLKERPTKYFWPLALLSIICGYILAFQFATPTYILSSLKFEGFLYTFISILFWGGGTVFGKKLLDDFGHLELTILRYYGGFIFSFFILILLLPMDFQYSTTINNILSLLHRVNLSDFLPVIYVALIPGLLAVFTFYKGLKNITAIQAAFLELIFPIGSAIIAWIFLEKPLSNIQIISGILLLITVTTINVLKTIRN